MEEANLGEKERMLAGAPYRADRGGLPAKREVCARLVFEYNHLPPDRWGDCDTLIRSILGKVGEGAEVTPPFRCDYGTNIEVGDKFYANYNLCVLDVAKVSVGNPCCAVCEISDEERRLYRAGCAFPNDWEI